MKLFLHLSAWIGLDKCILFTSLHSCRYFSAASSSVSSVEESDNISSVFPNLDLASLKSSSID
jgi:hypothetical protein